MNFQLIRSVALLAAGAASGLWAGALLWQGNSAASLSGKAVFPAGRIAVGGHEGTVGKRGSPAREAADNPADQKNRVEALAATFRRLNSAKNAEAMYFFPDMLVSLAALPGGDFPLLFQVMESDGKLDGESAITPLLRWASLDPRAALTFALGRKEFNSSERVLSAIVYQLARSDLSAAKTALANFPEKSEERRDAQRAITARRPRPRCCHRRSWETLGETGRDGGVQLDR